MAERTWATSCVYCCATPRWKTSEVDFMREKVPLLMLQQAAKGAVPARDFKAALRKKAEETGASAGVGMHAPRHECASGH